MQNQILCGDAFEKMAILPDGLADLVFVDPPYWMRVSDKPMLRVEGTAFDGCDDEWDNQFNSLEDYERFTEAWLRECGRLLKTHGSLWVIGGMQCIHTIGAILQRLDFWIINEVVWYKTNPTPNFHGTRLTNSHELLIWAVKSSKARYTFNYKTAREINQETVNVSEYAQGVRRQLGSVWHMPVCSKSERLRDAKGLKLHSTQKPEELLYRILAISSKPDDLVFDPFAGTMTTAAVAKRMGRRYLMIERDPEYVRLGEQRLEKVDPVLGEIEKALLDIRPQRITAAQLIAHGCLFAGEDFYFKGWKAARLLANGRLEVGGVDYDMHRAAGVVSGGKAARLNGFDYWQVCRDGALIDLKQIREQQRNALRILGAGEARDEGEELGDGVREDEPEEVVAEKAIEETETAKSVKEEKESIPVAVVSKAAQRGSDESLVEQLSLVGPESKGTHRD